MADSISQEMGNPGLKSLRTLLEAVNANVTQALLVENLRKWGLDNTSLAAATLAAAAASAAAATPPTSINPSTVLDYLAKSKPIPLQDIKIEEPRQQVLCNQQPTTPLLPLLPPLNNTVTATLTQDQENVLKGCFAINSNPKAEELEEIAEKLNLPLGSILSWFQTERNLQQLPKPNISFRDLVPIPPNVLFGEAGIATAPGGGVKYPTPPASTIGSDISSNNSPASLILKKLSGIKPETPLDLTKKVLQQQGLQGHDSPPPPLIINSDAGEEDDDEDDEEDDDDEEMDYEEDNEVEPPTTVIQNGTIANILTAKNKERLEKVVDEAMAAAAAAAAVNTPSPQLLPPPPPVVQAGGKSGKVPTVYSCDQCEKTFTKKSSITRHKYEHSGNCCLDQFEPPLIKYEGVK